MATTEVGLSVSQLVLPIRLPDHAVFETFHASGNNELVEYLQQLAAGTAHGGCWIVGAAATGKTHLLQATCERSGSGTTYLPADLLRCSSPPTGRRRCLRCTTGCWRRTLR